MDDSLLECVLESQSRLADAFAGEFDGDFTPALFGDGFQIFAGKVLHHEEKAVADLVGVNRSYDIRMVEAGGEGDLPLEARASNVVVVKIRRHDLESNLAPQRGALSFENRAHAALAEHIHQFVLAQVELAFSGQ